MNAVIYARYSSANQNEQSIEGQLRDAYEYAQRNGYTIIHEYIDRAMTGKNDNRHDFQQMISDAEKKQFDYVLVWKLDRFARNRYDSAIYRSKLKKCGVKIVSIKENISDAPEGIILESMLEGMAEYYSANLSQNVKRGIRESIEKGIYPGGHVPFGYRNESGKLVPDERTAPIVKYVFEQYAAGVGRQKIIKDLNAKGYRNSKGKPFPSNAFQEVLTNPVYAGHLMRNGVEVVGCATPIIDDETFQRVQKMTVVKKHYAAAERAHEKYLLQGKLFCGKCRCAMNGESGQSRNGTVYRYYACSTKKRRHACDKHNERKEELENYVVQQTIEHVLQPGVIKKIAAAVVKENRRSLEQEKIAEQQRIVDRLDEEANKLLDALMDAPKIMHARMYERMAAVEQQRQDAELALTQMRVAASKKYTEQDVIRWLQSICTGNLDNEDFKARLIDTLVNSVYVYDDKILILYNVTREKASSHGSLSGISKASGSDTTSLAPPYLRNPNLIPIGNGFGFLCFLSSIVV